MTRQEFIDFIAKNLQNKYEANVSVADISAVINGMNANERKDLVRFLLREYPPARAAVSAMMAVRAQTRANEIMSDDNLTLLELQEIF